MKDNVIIEIDPASGFCFGVENAISKAESLLEKGETIYSLGSMIHNPYETERLEKLGLQPVSRDELSKLKSKKLLFRAHGEPPESYEMVEENDIELIDATCPIVIKLQDRIRSNYLNIDPSREQIVIFGKKNHPETIGLLGQTDNSAILITDPDHIEAVDKRKKVFLYSQTTMDPEAYERLESNLVNTLSAIDKESLQSHCSICRQMKNRKPDLRRFVQDKDLVYFVSGKNSSNGKMLFQYCRQQNPETCWIENSGEINSNDLNGKQRIGISGATSTPKWQLEEIRESIKSILSI